MPLSALKSAANWSSNASSAPRSANSGTQMMSARSTSGSCPPAIPVRSFLRRSSYGTACESTVISGCCCLNSGNTTSANCFVSTGL